MTTGSLRFEGRIAGFGTAAGTRIVVGMWTRSPFGRFSDVMIENASSTYTFDEVRVVRVGLTRLGRTIRVVAGSLDASFTVGGVSPLGRLLRLVPGPIATRPDWLRLIDPVARLLVPGARTAGSAGNARREYYGVTGAWRITAVHATWKTDDLGQLRPLHPPVRFGFGSAPASPQLVDVVTTIVESR
jgi:hypothetical protein